jgi:hypothetical protein
LSLGASCGKMIVSLGRHEVEMMVSRGLMREIIALGSQESQFYLTLVYTLLSVSCELVLNLNFGLST